jgi:hypothetical protein
VTRREHELAMRRQLLLERSAQLRGDLAADGRVVAASLNLIDRGVALARSGIVRPTLLLAAVALFLVRPRAAWWLASRSLVLWPLLRRVLPRLVRIARTASASVAEEPVPGTPRGN